MMSDIFSSFDPASFFATSPMIDMFLFLNITLILMSQFSFWSNSYRMSISMIPMTSIITEQLSRTYMAKLKGLNHTVSSLFIIIIMVNLLGLVPYLFSMSSHLIFTLSLGLPLWLAMMMSTFTKSLKQSIAHFLPDGAPDWLNPFLVLIETTSITVRPMTLSFRLAANMSAGHIVLSLIGIYASAAWFNSLSATILLFSTSVGYILFEVAICMIQAYIFCLLLSLYSDDHAH